MSWLFLLLAGCMEILGVIVMKQFTLTQKKVFLLYMALCFILSFTLLSQAMHGGISMGIAYAIWTGIGAGGGVVVGIMFFKETKSPLKLLCLGLILFSSVGLKFLS